MVEIAGALAAAIAVNLSFLAAAYKGDKPEATRGEEGKALYILEGEYEIARGENKVRRSGFVCFRSGEIPHTLNPVSMWPSNLPGHASPDRLGGFWKEVSLLSSPLDMSEVLTIAEKYQLEIQTF